MKPRVFVGAFDSSWTLAQPQGLVWFKIARQNPVKHQRVNGDRIDGLIRWRAWVLHGVSIDD